MFYKNLPNMLFTIDNGFLNQSSKAGIVKIIFEILSLVYELD
jgi:hypothetical protein